MANDNKPIWKDYPLYCGNGDYVIEELVNGTWQTRKRFHVLRTPYGGGEVAANDMLCADLKTGYPETTGVTTHSAAYRRYRCQTGSTASQTQVFNFCQDWSYDEWDGEARTLSAPINGHADMRQRLFRSRFGETEEEIEIREMVRPQFSFDYSSDVSASNTAGYLTVTANEDYTIYCGSSWIQNLNTGGTEGEQTFYFYIEPYTGFTDRSTVIEITYLGYEGNYETVELPLVQRAIVPFFNVYPVQQSVNFTSGSTVFVVNTNVSFSVMSYQPWIEVSGVTPASYQAYNVALTYNANPGMQREAVIAFTYPISATQSGSTQTVVRQKEKKQECNEIWYTSTDNQIVTPYRTGSTYYGASIVSNTYVDGRGVILFDNCVTKIGGGTFYNCTHLSSIMIPSGATSIGEQAFYGCTNLTDIKIPQSVTSIKQSAFGWCSQLSAITIPNSVTSFDEGYTFSDCRALSSITIPYGITKLDTYTFRNCYALSSITIPDSVTYYGGGVFSNCTALQSIIIPSSVTYMYNGVFSGCTSLSSVTINANITNIGVGFFENCTALSSITIPNSVTALNESAFENCTALSSITIPDSVTSFGPNAFYYCISLSEVNYNGTIAQWNAISKSSNWKWQVPSSCVVHCTNGDTPI